MPKDLIIEVCESLADVPAGEWNRLAGHDPFVRHEFLAALEETGCATGETGWAGAHLLLKSGTRLAGVMPLYIKSHSYGEYVFDWAWADAYYRHGIDYYPKLLCAVPFSPVTGPRIMAGNERDQDRLIAGALALAQQLRVSSLHCLFPTHGEAERLYAHGMLARTTIQFHWSNRGYASFEDFLAGFNHDKRKKVKQERRKVRDAGVRFRWLEGTDIRERDWAFFERCYRQTYREHHSSPYLNLEFFCRVGRDLPEHFVLVIGDRAGKPVSASLNVRNGTRLCGRYWGALEYHPALHFETCYYQGIEFCITRRMETFEGGSRGEHKLARGLSPVETFSAHWLAHPQFADAIEKHLVRETRGVGHYVDELNDRSPYKTPSAHLASHVATRES